MVYEGIGIVAVATVVAQPQGWRAVPFDRVEINDSFWAPRQEVNRTATVAANLEQCDATGRLANFDAAAGVLRGEGGRKYEGLLFNDSDVYKALEGAAYALHLKADPALDAEMDAIIARIAAAQLPDGYINTYVTVNRLDKRWTNIKDWHELYCLGHLIEAGIAHHAVTGKRGLLDVAIKAADYLDATFGPTKKRNVSGHPEIEIALLRLYEHTGEVRYLELARFFLAERGHANDRTLHGLYAQDHAPLADQSEAVGHAVRAVYLYTAATDLQRITGDGAYEEAMRRIWGDLVLRKMYVTGGIGSSSHNEGFTVPYDLPNDQAYSETCASIGLLYWSHRMGLLHGEAGFFDVYERALYNGVLSGVSLDGRSFFYVNPLASRGRHHRQPWYTCACCPPNVLRLIGSLGGAIYAQDDESIVVNQYIGSAATVSLASGEVVIRQESGFPWEGRVLISFDLPEPRAFRLLCRRPAWCENADLTLSEHAEVEVEVIDDYAVLEGEWKPGDSVELDFPMEIRRVEANPEVKVDAGRVALQRGPLVYALEQADNPGGVRSLAMSRGAPLEAQFRQDLLGGVMVIRGTAERASAGREPVEARGGELYRHVAAAEPVEFTAIPYFAWDNRAAGEMVVWVPESVTLAEKPLDPTIRASASHCWQNDSLGAMYDGTEPERSGDGSIPRFTWWPRQGTTEWVQLDFTEPRLVSGVSVYWFSDAKTGGGCDAPESWRLLCKVGEEWREMPGPRGVDLDRFNVAEFPAVEATGVRIEVKLKEKKSSGILEWKIGEE